MGSVCGVGRRCGGRRFGIVDRFGGLRAVGEGPRGPRPDPRDFSRVRERERAETSIKRERDSAIEELRSQFAGLAITAAERVINRSLDGDAHRELIDQVLEEGSNIDGK